VITRDTYIEEMVHEHPQTVTLMMQFGVICIQCGEPIWGTVGEALDRKQIQDPEKVIEALNAMI